MSIYDRLAAAAHPATMTPQQTSYFSTPEESLDPHLFDGDRLKAGVRNGVLSVVYGFWRHRYAHPEAWSRVYLAGSGVSYQWSAARDPGDLDCLVGVDFVGFRRANPDYLDLSDHEIASHLNQELHDDLWPRTSDWHGYELTTYVNPNSYDITAIHPYAAYDLTNNAWAVHPDAAPQPYSDEWGQVVAAKDVERANKILARYNQALNEMDGVANPGLRLNAQVTLRAAAREAAAMFDEIHEGRKQAFSPEGQGYQDLHEFRYKAAKGSGALSALREIKDELIAAGLAEEVETYGHGLPDAREVLVRAAMSRRYRP